MVHWRRQDMHRPFLFSCLDFSREKQQHRKLFFRCQHVHVVETSEPLAPRAHDGARTDREETQKEEKKEKKAQC